VQRLAVVLRLKPGTRDRAASLVAERPPFDPEESGLDRHAVYLSDDEAVFVFEGADVEWQLDDLLDDFFHPALQKAIEEWRPLLEGEPRIATEAYSWDRTSTPGGAADVP
jgi:hypothetical protein